MLRVMVTGVNGFVGGHLVRELKSRRHYVIGIGREETPTAFVKKEADEYIVCDLTDASEVTKLNLSSIDAIINLAGLASAGASFGAEALYKKVNVDVLAIIGERLLETKSSARLVAISSGAVYDPNQPLPLTEEARTIIRGSPYALSKLEMEKATRELRERGLDCVIVRPFNHTGPGQALGFLVPDLVQKVAASKTSGHVLKIGNLKTRRDYSDVRDIVKGYADLAVAETLEYDVYNICSGKSYSGEEILALILELMLVKNDLKTEVDPSQLRPNDPPELYGTHERLTEETGWEPEIPLEKTIRDFISSID